MVANACSTSPPYPQGFSAAPVPAATVCFHLVQRRFVTDRNRTGCLEYPRVLTAAQYQDIVAKTPARKCPSETTPSSLRSPVSNIPCFPPRPLSTFQLGNFSTSMISLLRFDTVVDTGVLQVQHERLLGCAAEPSLPPSPLLTVSHF